MSLPRLTPPREITLTPEPLTPTTFASFGTVIATPLLQSLRSVPAQPPKPLHPGEQPQPGFANQNTALKTSPISPLTNTYPTNGPESKGLMSIFSCFPRQNTYQCPRTGQLRLRLEILERHPYTTQTFCPFNFSSSSVTSSTRSTPGSGEKKTYFLVIVAPTLKSSDSTPRNPPDLSKIRAFLAPVTADGGLGVAVTYAPGTWHAPMVVLGERRVDFLVSQFANGVADHDCQEVLVGYGDGKGVEVDLEGLGIDGKEEGMRLWRAKL